MKCENCGKEDCNKFVLLPHRSEDKGLVNIVCVDCAENSSAYCKKHEKPHIGFFDRSTACLTCIEETVEQKRSEGFNVWEILKEELPKEELLRLIEWAEFSAFAIRDIEEKCMIRAVVTKALRTNNEIENVIGEILSKKSVSSILPPAF